MELNGSFKEFHLENDPTCLYQAARAIQGLQRLYGKIPKITGRGPAASKIWELLERLSREEEDNKAVPRSSVAIEHLLLLDRSVDLLSPLVTQLTYEGLIDEIFGIKYSKVSISLLQHIFQIISYRFWSCNFISFLFHLSPFSFYFLILIM